MKLIKLYRLIKSIILNLIKPKEEYIFIEDYVVDGRILVHKTTKGRIYYEYNKKVLLLDNGVKMSSMEYFCDIIKRYEPYSLYMFTSDYSYINVNSDRITISKGEIRPIQYCGVWDNGEKLFTCTSSKFKQYGYYL